MALQILNPRLNKLELGYTTVDSLPTENINPRAIYRIVDKDNGKEYFWRWKDGQWEGLSQGDLASLKVNKPGIYKAAGSPGGPEELLLGETYIFKNELDKEILEKLYSLVGEDGVLLKVADMSTFCPPDTGIGLSKISAALFMEDWLLTIKKIGEEYLLMNSIKETLVPNEGVEDADGNPAQPKVHYSGDFYATGEVEFNGYQFAAGWHCSASLYFIISANMPESMIVPSHIPNLPIRLPIPREYTWANEECKNLIKLCFKGWHNMADSCHYFFDAFSRIEQQEDYFDIKAEKGEISHMPYENSNELVYIQENILPNPELGSYEYMYFSYMAMMASSNSVPSSF